MNIRLLTVADSKIFRALRIEAVNDSPSSFDEAIAEIIEKTPADTADQLQSHGRGDFVLGAFDDNNHLIGMVGFYRAIHAKLSHKGTLWGMYVTRGKRGERIGNALVATAIEHARNLPGISHITLRVRTSNDAAKRLYESNGFQVYGIEKQSLKDDEVFYDEALMQLFLSSESL